MNVPEISSGPLGRHVAREEKLAEPLQRGQRGAQLVRGDGEKFVLCLVELAQASRGPRHFLFELVREVPLALREPGVFDGQRQVERQRACHAPRGRGEVSIALGDERPRRSPPRVQGQHEPPARSRRGRGKDGRWTELRGRAGRDAVGAAGFENEPHPMHSQGAPRQLGDDGQTLPQRPFAGEGPLNVQEGIELGSSAP